MCGICGEIRWGGHAADVGAVARMTGAMASRGPDADGVVAHGPVAFGHRRLSIIDLSARGAQPMVDSDESKPDSTPSPDQQIDAIEELERKRRLASRVMDRVAEDPIIPGMLKHEQAGVGKASELAALLNCSVKEIYRARERLAHNRNRVLEEERKHEQERMKGHAPSP